jgi:hypothetical protein
MVTHGACSYAMPPRAMGIKGIFQALRPSVAETSYAVGSERPRRLALIAVGCEPPRVQIW